jgi:hypothetical protein
MCALCNTFKPHESDNEEFEESEPRHCHAVITRLYEKGHSRFYEEE